ncbi:MAG: tetratricopeptide repeat protein [Chloroflexi bacterium]|nr:tetratricopeptide repeat protein [Chloroflexota bacterium]
MRDEVDFWQAFDEGERLRAAEEYATALVAFDRALALKPDSAQAWLHRGLCLTKLKKHQRALASIEKSLRYNPASAWTWFFHGDVLFEMGRHVQSVDSLDRAIQLRGGDFPEVWKVKNATLKVIEVWLKEHLPPKPSLEAYDLVTWVEETLHMFIRQRLQQAFGREETEWWQHGVPQPIRVKCASRREEDLVRRPLYNYSDLIDLKDIMDKNWRHFENDLPKAGTQVMSKKEFLDGLGSLNEIRKTVMHPVRGNLTEADMTLARQMKSVVEGIAPLVEG